MILLRKSTSAPVAPLLKGQGAMPLPHSGVHSSAYATIHKTDRLALFLDHSR